MWSLAARSVISSVKGSFCLSQDRCICSTLLWQETSNSWEYGQIFIFYRGICFTLKSNIPWHLIVCEGKNSVYLLELKNMFYLWYCFVWLKRNNRSKKGDFSYLRLWLLCGSAGTLALSSSTRVWHMSGLDILPHITDVRFKDIWEERRECSQTHRPARPDKETGPDWSIDLPPHCQTGGG